MLADPPSEDFVWDSHECPHAIRRREMLKGPHAPKLQKLLNKSDWTLGCWILGYVCIQLVVSWIMRDADWFNLIIAAYCIGGTCNHSLALAMHELAHNLAFGFRHITANRFLAYMANLPLTFPAASSFKKYHLLHHKSQGDEVIDTDLPTELEARIFRHAPGKLLWVSLQALFYGVRPMATHPIAVNSHELLNFLIQLSFNGAIVYFFGWKSLAYLTLSTILGYGIHPISGHFIAEHYMFVKGYETYSYYGPLNFLTFNVGFHNELHDFPNIPGRLLPDVKAAAPDFYDNIPCHYSWTKVLYDFVMDPEMTIYKRIKRHVDERNLVPSYSTMLSQAFTESKQIKPDALRSRRSQADCK